VAVEATAEQGERLRNTLLKVGHIFVPGLAVRDISHQPVHPAEETHLDHLEALFAQTKEGETLRVWLRGDEGVGVRLLHAWARRRTQPLLGMNHGRADSLFKHPPEELRALELWSEEGIYFCFTPNYPLNEKAQLDSWIGRVRPRAFLAIGDCEVECRTDWAQLFGHLVAIAVTTVAMRAKGGEALDERIRELALDPTLVGEALRQEFGRGVEPRVHHLEAWLRARESVLKERSRPLFGVR